MSHGFTLIETLIALVIASVTALVLLQSITAIAGATASAQNAVARAFNSELVEASAVDAISGATAVYIDKQGAFEGDSTGFSAQTRRPAFAPRATLRNFSMSLDAGAEGTALMYQEGATRLEVAFFQDENIRFEYVYRPAAALYAGEPASLYAAWPPAEGFDPVYEYFIPPPKAVVIVSSDGDILWAASSDSWIHPPLRTVDLETVL